MSRQRRVRLGAARWRELVEGQARSGVSVAAFCAGEGVSAASFYQWRTRLAGTGVPADGAASVTRRSEVSAVPAFVDLGGLASAGRLELRLELGGGLVLQLARG